MSIGALTSGVSRPPSIIVLIVLIIIIIIIIIMTASEDKERHKQTEVTEVEDILTQFASQCSKQATLGSVIISI